MLSIPKHTSFIVNLDKSEKAKANQHLKMNAVYWGLTAMLLMNQKVPKQEIIDFVCSCFNEDGGYGGFTGYDSHLLYTLSAIQIMASLDSLNLVDTEKVANFVSKLQKEDGSFMGDCWGEIDTRFSYCAISTLKIINKLSVVNTKNAIDFVLRCRNFDGAFGTGPDAESHSGMVFCCLGVLDILNYKLPDSNTLAWWLSERQLPNGGLNGRPGKLEDVCYSWWVLSSLSILGKLSWINAEKTISFILDSQDESGGICPRKDLNPDVYHTLFGICGLSLLGYPGLQKVDPCFCMPESVVIKLKLK